ncbi:MAG: hypothetical protein ACRDRN_20630 [Sciscionella sp.]
MAGATVRVQLHPDWRTQLSAAEHRLLDETFGPAILADMQAGTPVLTSRLRDSERFEVVDNPTAAPELHVGSYPDDEGPVPYKLAVELGFHGEEFVREYVVHRGFGPGDAALGYVVHAHIRMGNSPEQPYMRPALWRVRTP